MNHQKTGFATGTLVHTRSGLRPIQSLRIGDLVLTRSPQGIISSEVIIQIKKTAQSIYRCTLLEQEKDKPCTVHYLFSASEQQIFTDADWISVEHRHEIPLHAYNLNRQTLSLGQTKPIFAASNRTQQTFGFNAATFSLNLQPNGKDDEFIYISPHTLIHHQPNTQQYRFAEMTASLSLSSVNWNNINRKSLILPVYQLQLANSDNYFVGKEGILARAA